MISFDLQIKIAEWKRKVADRTITDEELKEAIKWLREDRQTAAASAKPKSKKAETATQAAAAAQGFLQGLLGNGDNS